MTSLLTTYLNAVDALRCGGEATEHSYRPALKALLENFDPSLVATNEPKQIQCGAPDFVLTRAAIPVGYVEAKDLGKNLNDAAYREQFDRYRAALPNLVITDYLTFQFWRHGELRAEIALGAIDGDRDGDRSGGGDRLKPDRAAAEKFLSLLKEFTTYRGLTISDGDTLAKIMAGKARLLGTAIAASLRDAVSPGLATQRQVFAEMLDSELTIPAFADMYAQTLLYGMFAARLSERNGEIFTPRRAGDLLTAANPFLQKLFQELADRPDPAIGWLVESLAEMFNGVAVKDIFTDFRDRGQDPFIHFYEQFLAAYDPAARKNRGVYYTPYAAVKFIVEAVDDLLQSEFGLPNGLADRSKIVRDGAEFHRVQILDPATGTGTFLMEVVNKIHSQFAAANAGMWNAYVDKELLPRLHGFEILMSPYTMAHLKVGMKLQATGWENRDARRLQIYLTNALTDAVHVKDSLWLWLSQEVNGASVIKQRQPIMIVMGNPPYSGESQNVSINKKNTAFSQIEKLLADYKREPAGGQLQERNPKWLNDDYVKFIRLAENFVERNETGIVALVNNHSFLDNPTFRGMRRHLLNSFDQIFILNLHGSVKKKEVAPDGGKDEGIFNITVGATINIFIKTGKKKAEELARIHYAELWGKQCDKFEFLLTHNLRNTKWQALSPVAPHYFFVPKSTKGQKKYESGFSVKELFPLNSVGIVTGGDSFLVADNQEILRRRIEKLLTDDVRVADLRDKYGVTEKYATRLYRHKLTVELARLNKSRNGKSDIDNRNFVPINYRPFERKVIYFAEFLIERSRDKVMRHFISGNNLGLLFKRGLAEKSPPAFACNHIIEFRSWSRPGMQGGDYVAPLYLYPQSGDLDASEPRRPNLNPAIVANIAAKIGRNFVAEKDGYKNHFAPADIFDYLYAVLHSPSYREKYAEFLKIDFPRVPYPENAAQFDRLATLGARLRQLHLLARIPPLKTTYPVGGDNKVENVQYAAERVYLNATQYVGNVPAAAWEFYLGGYQPAQKYLKDRREQILSYAEIEHYQKIIAVLVATAEIMNEIG
ncbi:DNA methyltransferase [Planctomycetales bacterium]|nr:DNA methyltransferase [Planctomycetales bacterium]